MKCYSNVISTFTIAAFLITSHASLHSDTCATGTCPVNADLTIETPAAPVIAETEPCQAYNDSCESINWAPAVAIGAIAVIAVVTLVIQDSGLHHNHAHY